MHSIDSGLRVELDHPGDVVRRVGDFVSATCGLGDGPPLEINALNDLRLFFGSVFGDLSHLYWVVNKAEFILPKSAPEGQTLLRDTIEEDEVGWAVMRPGFLERYSDCLLQDWLDLIGLPQPPDSLPIFKNRHFSGPRSTVDTSYIAQVAHTIIVCIDGLFWEFFSSDEGIVDTVRSHLALKPSLRITDACLSSSPAF